MFGVKIANLATLATSRQLMLKNLQNFLELKEPLGGNKSG